MTLKTHFIWGAVITAVGMIGFMAYHSDSLPTALLGFEALFAWAAWIIGPGVLALWLLRVIWPYVSGTAGQKYAESQVKHLQKMRDAGVLTEAEYQQKVATLK